jgi:protein-disulfide isomerase
MESHMLGDLPPALLRALRFLAVPALFILILVIGAVTIHLWLALDSLSSQVRILEGSLQTMEAEVAVLPPERPMPVVQPTFESMELATLGAPYLGEDTAPLTLLEFTDYQCPYCRRHAINTLPRLISEYVQMGKLRYVIREMPVEANHPLAAKAAEAALCAHDQGRYWEMHDTLFANPDRMLLDELKQHAEALGLDVIRFDNCLDVGEKRSRVLDDVKAGKKAGMRGTPAFFLGPTPPSDEGVFLVTEIIHGAESYEELAQRIDTLLITTTTPAVESDSPSVEDD